MWTSPRAIVRSTPSSARTPGKRLVIPCSSRMGCVSLRVLGGDQLDRGLVPALDLLALLHAEAGLDAVGGHVGAELVDGGEDLAVLDELLHRRDVVEADHLDLARLAGRVERLDHAERHRI